MGNILVGMIIIAIIAGASYKIYWNKKNNIMCSGCSACPSNNTCPSVQNDHPVKRGESYEDPR